MNEINVVRDFEESLFEKWQNHLEKRIGHDDIKRLFCPDGLHYLGEVYQPDGKHWEMKETPQKAEIIWSSSRIRCLFLTKDYNHGGDDEGFDSRIETGINNSTRNLSDLFYRRYISLLYGLCHTNPTDGSYIGYSSLPEPKELLKAFQTSLPSVRINLKKLAGGSICEDKELKSYIESDKDYIIKQMRFYDANVIVCCYGTDYKKNPIMNLLRDLYPDLTLFDTGNNDKFVFYSPSQYVIVLHEWHPSYPGISDETYYSAIDRISRFIKTNPRFLKSFYGYKDSCPK